MRILIFIMYFFSLLASSHEYTKNEITIYHPILKITSETSKIGAGYFKIINNSNQTIFLKEIMLLRCVLLKILLLLKPKKN